MQFELTKDLSEKVFTKVGALANSDLDLTNECDQISFCKGFVDSLQKEAEMSPEMATGFLNYICNQGACWMEANKDGDKTAGLGTAVWDFAKDHFPKATEGVQKFFAPLYEGAVRRAVDDTAKKYLGGLGGNITEMGGKAWEYLKSPDFLKGVAPYLIGGLGGMLIPRLFSKEPGAVATGAGAAGGALLGKYLADNGGAITNTVRNGIDKMIKGNADWVNFGR